MPKGSQEPVKIPTQTPWGTRNSGTSLPSPWCKLFVLIICWVCWVLCFPLPVCNFVSRTLRISTFTPALATTALEFPPQIYNHYFLSETFKISTLSRAGGGGFNILPQNPWWLFCAWDLWRSLLPLSRKWRLPFWHLYLRSLSQSVSRTSLSNCDFTFLSSTKLCVHRRNEHCGISSWPPLTHRFNQGRLKILEKLLLSGWRACKSKDHS